MERARADEWVDLHVSSSYDMHVSSSSYDVHVSSSYLHTYIGIVERVRADEWVDLHVRDVEAAERVLAKITRSKLGMQVSVGLLCSLIGLV